MSDELVYQLALELIPGLGDKGAKQLISYCGSASQVLKANKSQLTKVPGVGDKLANIVLGNRPIKEAENIIAEAEKLDFSIYHYTNSSYPQRLKQIPDSPNIIFTKGSGELNPKRCIAIVGTRKATDYGKSITEKLVSELAGLGVTVVSGLAYGIDIYAHKACLKYNIPTFAALAGGLDRIYPSSHKKYVQEMLSNGGILSESLPGTKPDPHLFPARNRIIAGMADATVVVEAAEKGGALITANIADSYDRTVFAVPGNVGNTYSEGTNKLISSQKALIYSGIEDLIYHLNWDVDEVNKKVVELPELPQEEQIVYDLLSQHDAPIEIDLISIKSQIPINQVASLLLNLEFKNLVKSLPGKKYCLC